MKHKKRNMKTEKGNKTQGHTCTHKHKHTQRDTEDGGEPKWTRNQTGNIRTSNQNKLKSTNTPKTPKHTKLKTLVQMTQNHDNYNFYFIR